MAIQIITTVANVIFILLFAYMAMQEDTNVRDEVVFGFIAFLLVVNTIFVWGK